MKSNVSVAPGSISCHALGVRSLERSVAFYRDILGAQAGRGRTLSCGLRCADFRFRSPTRLELIEHRARDTRAPDAGFENGYWKIGLTLPDVAAARARLRSRGIEVSEPAQFEDVGYVCHLSDPDGYTIELLQHTFGPVTSASIPGDPLAAATLGQITLRISDPGASLAFYRDRLGMRLLSRQIVPRYDFTLYFLAYTDETPPLPDIDAVANRPWLWQRPYTVLELQHRRGGADGSVRYRTDETSGFLGLSLQLAQYDSASGGMPQKIQASSGVSAEQGGRIRLRDPDGYAVSVLTPG